MSIPLIQKPEKDDINTSIIAIKRNIERINMLLGLVDNESPDLSGFATKQELQDAVTELQPVDEVTIGNMQSVTSNAVAEKFGNNVFTFPLHTDRFIASGTEWTNYMWVGTGYTDIFNYFIPNISGKTKKLRLLIQTFTEADNYIYVGMKRSADVDYTILVNRIVWGGVAINGFACVDVAYVDASFLAPYSSIAIRSSDSRAVAIGYVYAQVYYE